MIRYLLLALLICCGCDTKSAPVEFHLEFEPSEPARPVGEELSRLTGVSVAKSGEMYISPDGSAQAHGTLLGILRFLCDSPTPRFRDEAPLPSGMFFVSLPPSVSVPGSAVTVPPEAFRLTWKKLTEAYKDAFDVVIVPERREEDTYSLEVVDSESLKLREARPADGTSWATWGRGLRFTGYSMDRFAWWLEGDIALFDATALTGDYTFDLRLSTLDGLDVDAKKVIDALRIVGLDLRQRRQEVDVILIRKAPNR